MIIRQIAFLALGLASAVAAPLAAQASAPQDAAAATRVQADINYLAADARDGRGINTPGLDSAAAYLAREFAGLKLVPGGSDGYFQPFMIDSSAPGVLHTTMRGAHVKNIIGVLPGAGPLAGQVIVIGAHYDHLGYDEPGMTDPQNMGVVHNGADDNASGAAGVVELARRFTQRAPKSRRTIVFMEFTAEEVGDVGSEHYVKHPAFPLDSTVAMLNMDMVGRLRNGRLIVYGVKTAPQFESLLDSLNATYRFDLHPTGDGWGPSDQASFYAAGIPVLFFFTDLHKDYHAATDDADKINAPGEAKVLDLVHDVAWNLATRPDRPTYVSFPPPKAPAMGNGAWLGSVPDMTESPGGVLLSGVQEGSPAAAAGIQRGDLIVQIGETKIANLYDMANALAAHKPGDVVTIAVMRDGARKEFTVTLGKRGG
jgi:Peptidase family M28/PDZ domain